MFVQQALYAEAPRPLDSFLTSIATAPCSHAGSDHSIIPAGNGKDLIVRIHFHNNRIILLCAFHISEEDVTQTEAVLCEPYSYEKEFSKGLPKLIQISHKTIPFCPVPSTSCGEG